MGCDIGMYAEVLRHGRWSLAEPVERNPAFDPEHPQEEPEWKPTEVFRDRNYALLQPSRPLDLSAQACGRRRSPVPL
jgi:hypothetical protein